MNKNSLRFAPIFLAILLTGCSSNSQTSSVQETSVEDVNYTATISVVGEGAKKGITLDFLKDGKVAGEAVTDRKGQIALTLPKANYEIKAVNLPDGYYQVADVTTGDEAAYTVNLSTKIIEKDTPENTTYYKGSIVYDYEFTLTDSSTAKISKLMEGKEAVVLNFWGVTCPYCVAEMPDLDTYYQKNNDKISLVGINSYSILESDDIVDEFLTTNDLSFPVTYYETTVSDYFAVSGWPTTVVIDRYGRVASMYSGYVNSLSGFEKLIGSVLGDDYSPTY